MVGCEHATEVLRDGDVVTVSCAEGAFGRVYAGEVPFEVTETDLRGLSGERRTQVLAIVANPDMALKVT